MPTLPSRVNGTIQYVLDSAAQLVSFPFLNKNYTPETLNEALGGSIGGISFGRVGRLSLLGSLGPIMSNLLDGFASSFPFFTLALSLLISAICLEPPSSSFWFLLLESQIHIWLCLLFLRFSLLYLSFSQLFRLLFIHAYIIQHDHN